MYHSFLWLNLFLWKLDSSRCNFRNNCTWLQLITPLKKYQFFYQDHAGSSFKKRPNQAVNFILSFNRTFFSVTVVIRKNVFISEQRKLIELLKHKPFLRKGCLRISFKWLRHHFDEIEIRFFALHMVESDMKW